MEDKTKLYTELTRMGVHYNTSSTSKLVTIDIGNLSSKKMYKVIDLCRKYALRRDIWYQLPGRAPEIGKNKLQ